MCHSSRVGKLKFYRILDTLTQDDEPCIISLTALQWTTLSVYWEFVYGWTPEN